MELVHSAWPILRRGFMSEIRRRFTLFVLVFAWAAILVRGAVLYGDLTHELAFTRNSLSQLLLASGFEQVGCFEPEVVVHGARSGVRAILWKLIRAALRVYTAAETGEAGRDAVLTRNLLAVAVK